MKDAKTVPNSENLQKRKIMRGEGKYNNFLSKTYEIVEKKRNI